MMVVVEIAEMAALTIVLVVLVIYAVYQASPKRIGYIPLPTRAVSSVIAALGISDGAAVFYDLGCGDGRVLAPALHEHPKLRAVGVEINPLVALLARWRLHNLPAQIIRGDIMRTDLRSATHVFTYLNHPTMADLEPKFAQELSKGSRLVSCDFPLPTRKPTKTLKIGESWQLGQTLYIYEY